MAEEKEGTFKKIIGSFDKGYDYAKAKKKAAFLTQSQRKQQKSTPISRFARKAINIASPRGGLVKALTADAKKKTGKRGRPKGTYRMRILPSGQRVKVPTHIYKKMLAAERTQMRLAQAQRQQYAEQVAMQQDPRFQSGGEEQFLAEQDPNHEYNVAMAQAGQPILVQDDSRTFQQAQGALSQFARGVSKIGNLGAKRQEQVVDVYGRTLPPQYPQTPQLQQRPQPQGQGLQREPRVSLFSPTPNILNAPNIFNRPGDSTLLLPRRRGLI